ncbi:DUF3455 domain-containing protein [Bradyrhizobium sp. McL0615]|uniref:DUF3455 domain-containing protein n=1 Tax=Bradyrhizobium sp. McL0615 TaxID=3415673 RepID=UPI003CED66D2
MSFPKNAVLTAIFLTGSLVNATAQTALPEAIAAPGETPMLTLHAEGAQVYECKTSSDGALVWVLREPIATLLSDGKTVGRHYAGPTWEHSDGSAVVGQVVGTAPGSVANDIPWLKLGVTSRRGNGVLSAATTVQRINTAGGRLNGACYKSGTYESVPYSADYVFLRKG